MFDGLFDDGIETAYGYGKDFEAAAQDAYDAVPDEGYVEVVDDEGIDLGSRERYDALEDVDARTGADEPFDLKVVVVEYRHEPTVDPDVASDGDGRYHPVDDLDGVRHPNDELAGLEHPLDSGFPS